MNTLTIDTITIRKDSEGRYCLNDLHKAAGGEIKDQPKEWLKGNNTKEMIEQLESEGIPSFSVKLGRTGGTYVCKELVYAYAMWISPKFHLKVIRVFEEYATKGMVMQPGVAAQAINDPKVFMAKALMLAQETLDAYAKENAELKHDRDHVSVRQFERELGIYLSRPQKNRMASYARKFCLDHGLEIQKEVMQVQSPYYQGDTEVNIYPVEALRYARDLMTE